MTLALIAGAGGLPPVLADALVAQSEAPLICEMRGFPSEILGEFERVPFRIEIFATFLSTLQSRGVTQVCMAGAVERPVVDPTAIDSATLPMVPRLQAAMAKGDDGTLREIIAIFEEHGFDVIGAHDIAPELRPRAGIHTKANPPDLTADIAAAQTALADMGRADLGQAIVLRAGQVIATEDQNGTEAMLRAFHDPLIDHSGTSTGGDIIGIASDLIGGVVDWVAGADEPVSRQAAGAILFKAPKPNQNLKADMPVIGPDTAMQAAEAGLAGVVIVHGGVMVIDLAQVVSILDAHDMFLVVMP